MFSEIIAGTMRWGIWGANHSPKQVQELIQVCLDENITTFDHADIYGGHTTEELFGDAWKEMDIDREKVQFISKCGIVMNSEQKPSALKYYNYNSIYILNCVDESLQNLKTDYLDTLLLHRPSPLMNPEEIANTFQILKDNGKVKNFGVSNFSVSQFELLNQYFPLITNQIEISVNEISAFDNGILDLLMMKNIRPTAWSVMGNYFSESSIQNSRIKKIIPVIGTSKSESIIKLKKALLIDLELEDWFKILEAIKGKEVN